MAFRVVYSPEARKDLFEIYDYLAEAASPHRALAYMERIALQGVVLTRFACVWGVFLYPTFCITHRISPASSVISAMRSGPRTLTRGSEV